VFARIDSDDIVIYAFVSGPDGRKMINRRAQGKVKSARKVAQDLANELLEAGAAELLKNE
jgi:porphobilinogen deaminase